MSEAVLDGLEETWGALRALLADVSDDEWSRPTPCPEWTVRDLAAHLGSVEGFFQGLPQPEAPPTPTDGIDDWTAAGVETRRSWSTDEVVAEIEEASTKQLEHLRSLDDAGWEQEVMGPLGPTTERGRAGIRLVDLYLHLLDLRAGLGRPLDVDAEPTACRLTVERGVDLAGWGAVKKAGIEDGRIRLDLSGPGGGVADLVVSNRRGSLVDPEGDDPSDAVVGTAPAFVLVAAGRERLAEEAGGVVARGADARRLLEGYRIFT